jgi:hypothetical protein
MEKSPFTRLRSYQQSGNGHEAIAQKDDWDEITRNPPHDPQLAGLGDRIGAPFRAQLFEQARDVRFDGIGRDVELCGDLLVGAPGRDLLQHG